MNNKQDVEREQISSGIRYHVGCTWFWQVSGSWLIYLEGRGEEGAGAQKVKQFSLHTEKDNYW